MIVDEAVAWLGRADRRPFCLFVWFHAPHEIIAVPDTAVEPYRDHGAEKATYFGCVSMVDAEIGRLLAALDSLGRRDETLVMFTSDNGPETLRRYKSAVFSHGSPGPLRGMKLHMYEGGYRVPGIIRWPGKTRHSPVCDQPICGLDVLPTFCAAAGVDLPAKVNFDGASFLSIFDAAPVARSVPLYWQYDRAIGGQFTISLLAADRWKLLADAKRNVFELYNLNTDPSESHNRAPVELDRTRRMAAVLAERHRQINSP